MPLASVVLIFLNEERFLNEAVASVLDQKLTDWELILVDDGSTDGSPQIARDLAAKDERIRYVDHSGHANHGMSASRNLGVSHASAPYLAFLDGDDVWSPDKLAEQVDVLEKMPDVAMVVGAIQYWFSWDPATTDEDFVLLTGGGGDFRIEPPEAALTFLPLGEKANAGMDLLIRRSAFDAVGGFEERFRDLFEDQAFITKVLLRYPIYVSARAWLRYRRHDASCLGRATRADFLRARGHFLDWFREDEERLRDSRVAAKVRRARRELRYLKLYCRISESLPAEFKSRVKHALAPRNDQAHERSAQRPR